MRKAPEEQGMNMTPMIDIVFQLIIFFVTTVDMERKSVDDRIRLAMAPHGPAVEKKDPRTITIDVDDKDRLSVSRVPISLNTLQVILKKAVSEYGQTVPVVIRGDARTKHEDIKKIMDACAAAGLWKVKFGAVKEHA